MQNKKGGGGLFPNSNATIGNANAEPISKHQHIAATQQHLRLLQYGLKIPNSQLNSSNHIQYEQQPVSVHGHVLGQVLQSNSHQQQYTPPNIHTNPLHQRFLQTPANNHYLIEKEREESSLSSSPLSPPNQSHPHQSKAHHQSMHAHPPKANPSQLWPPHQQMVHQVQHYHQPKLAEAPDPAPPHPVATPSFHLIKEDRKKYGGTQIRSPSAKRPADAPVTLQGWLHKQGSEGLMLWKKRWFVLSQYCLFYYKGPEEEKLLGSILLPSYTVSVCNTDDKVNKKFSFKCEHTNMRTYMLSADSHELMMQWIRVLNLACLLQTTNYIENESLTNTTCSPSAATMDCYNQLNETNSDSGFAHQFAPPASYHHPQQQHHPHHAHQQQHMRSPSNATDFSNQDMMSQYNQPLYANAPPKPRRLNNDTDYSSPSSPDPSGMDQRYVMSGESKYVTLQQPRASMQAARTIRAIRSPSASIYDAGNPEYIQIRHNMVATSPLPPQNSNGFERRTPDTYGRSKLSHSNKGPHPHPHTHLHSNSDYEEVYTEQYMYKRPLSPLAYENIKKTTSGITTPLQRAFTPVTMSGPRHIPRPHSADFLEYETHAPRQARPKSSLEINRNSTGDNYFYSEERYADKMRKSAHYLSNAANLLPHNEQRHETFPLIHPAIVQQSPNYNHRAHAKENNPMRSRSALSEGSLSKEVNVDEYIRHETYPYYLDASDTRQLHQQQQQQEQLEQPLYDYNDEAKMCEYEPFTRSASARLANIEQRLQGNGRRRAVMNREGERKREESMKRLLEWKQRMLQSPLNRKLKPQQNEEYARHQHNKVPKNSDSDLYFNSMDRNRTAFQYNSYSSDDEENMDRSKENMQAGRAVDAIDTTTTSASQYSSSMPVFNSQIEPPICDQNMIQISASEIKNTGAAFVKSILADLEQADQLEEIGIMGEENYMTMTPKKIDVFDATQYTIYEQSDENPYVEMTQGALADDVINNVYSPYEFVCFTEPLYMELQQNDPPKTIQFTHNKLPDILQRSNHAKSDDGAEADDEASKDLESMETFRRHPAHFSLFDNFRPASYYLGATLAVAELQDSSDSEIVSPPPIPPSADHQLDEKHWLHDSRLNQIKPAEGVDAIEAAEAAETNYLEDDTFAMTREARMREIDYERMLKRRPVSNEFRDELESLKSDFNLSMDNDMLYEPNQSALNINQLNQANEYGHYHDYENLCISTPIAEPTSTHSCLISLFGEADPLTACISSGASSNASTIGVDGAPDAQSPIYFSDDPSFAQLEQAAPYYYSDLSMNASHVGSTLTLNNQRKIEGMLDKRDIMRIINPIRANTNVQLAAEARSVSVDFLNLTDKSGKIDKKNLYESDTLKRMKAPASPVNSCQSNPETINLYPRNNNIVLGQRRSHSLEDFLENVEQCNDSPPLQAPVDNESGCYLWDEDSIWQTSLRTASARHTKSLDNLDCICEASSQQQPKKLARGIVRGVTYVNDNIYNMPLQDNAPHKAAKAAKNSFSIDREKLRQWDLMSSAPTDQKQAALFLQKQQQQQQQSGPTCGVHARLNTDLDVVTDVATIRRSEPVIQNPASGSSYLNCTRDTFPRTMFSKHAWNSHAHSHSSQHIQSTCSPNLNRHHGSDYSIGSHQDMKPNNTKAQLLAIDASKRLENLQKLEQLKQHLFDLEKQYEKGKPLVNLVDNMVKLGSLYHHSPAAATHSNNYNPYVSGRLEFNQEMQERRLLAEEKRDWNRVNSNHSQLQDKVKQLYQLDQLIQEESGTLQGLQEDKEEIERALGGLRYRFMNGLLHEPGQMEQARKQQIVLENELSRVHLTLAENSKTLEESIAGNARLESELLVLKQKLQQARSKRNSPQCSNAGDSLACAIGGTSAMLESDLHKVQQKVGDLSKQRYELSMQVRQLTDRSNINTSFFNHNSSVNLMGKKRIHPLWRETDLDTMYAIDHGEKASSAIPLYINTDLSKASAVVDYRIPNCDDDLINDDDQSYLPAIEKQEIKTVRIVKRESERRQREYREKVTSGKWDPLLEEQGSKNAFSVQAPESEALSPPAGEQLMLSSPVFKSEAARQIITEVQEVEPEQAKHAQHANRRLVPKEKRRHYTAPHNNIIMKSLNNVSNEDDENAFDKIIMNSRRARDDLDMERALRQRNDTPDVVRSTLTSKELKYNESTIDNLLGTPNKINIPERYIPEQLPQLSTEEQERRLRKVESIKKMLSNTTIMSGSSTSSGGNATATGDEAEIENAPGVSATKINEEKKQRVHLLQLNQILAKQVMEMSKLVAVRASRQQLELASPEALADDDDTSPVEPRPLYQQRDNFYN